MEQGTQLPASLASFLFPGELPEKKQSDSELSLSASQATEEFEENTEPEIEDLILEKDIPSISVLDADSRAAMAQMIDQNTDREDRDLAAPLNSGVPAHLSSLVPTMMEIAGRILHELEMNIPRLLSLNPSRREAVAQHLDHLAGHTSGPGSLTGSIDAAGGLRRWIEGPRSPNQNSALQTYFEEIALVTLGQAILLKAWSDRGIRPWAKNDLGRLNWALSTSLRPHVPLDRESWQMTRPNLYSWYNPSSSIQVEIWDALEYWRITDEGPGFLLSLFAPIRQAQPSIRIARGYDQRFFKAIWQNLSLFGLDLTSDASPLKRARTAFSPTLRDGSLVRTGPVLLNWMGMESSPFQLLITELAQLWWGPAAPPLWTVGSGLEAHSRDQLTLALASTKPSLLSRITEMEACDLAFVLEENAIRAQGRSLEASRFREQLELLPYFKKLRAPGTTLGDLQACVAISKIRPGGLLWWAREESISNQDGTEMLNFVLEKGKLVCEWDLSGLEHSLPSSVPLFPKFLYLFKREPDIEQRLSNRPIRLHLQGQIRSHVEIPSVLEDAMAAVHKQVQPRGQWQIAVHRSPTPQRDWAEKWPDPACQNSLRTLERLRTHSVPLANIATIRETPPGDPSRGNSWLVSPSLRGFWISVENTPEKRKIVAHPLPRAHVDGKDSKNSACSGSGFLILVPDESWIPPLSHFLQSEIVHSWLDNHVERKSGKWILTDQALKWIPIPKPLLRAIGVTGAKNAFAIPLPGEWEKLASEVSYQPKLVRESLNRELPKPKPTDANDDGTYIHAAIFVRACRALDQLLLNQSRLFSIVAEDGKIKWRYLLDILPKHECVSVPFHPRIKISGSLSPHVPIGRIEKMRSPLQGIFLITESGQHLHVASDSQMISDMLWDQVQGLAHPTWNELLQYLKLPRKLELAETTASDVLRSHGEYSTRVQELRALISACLFF